MIKEKDSSFGNRGRDAPKRNNAQQRERKYADSIRDGLDAEVKPTEAYGPFSAVGREDAYAQTSGIETPGENHRSSFQTFESVSGIREGRSSSIREGSNSKKSKHGIHTGKSGNDFRSQKERAKRRQVQDGYGSNKVDPDTDLKAFPDEEMEGLSDGNANPFESNRQPGQKTAPGGKSSSAVQKQRIRRSYARQLRAEETEEAGEESIFSNTRNREISGKQKTVFGSSRQSSGTSWHERKSGSVFSEDSQADTAGGFYRNEAAAEQAVKGSKEAGASAATSRRKGMRWRSSDSLKAEAVGEAEVEEKTHSRKGAFGGAVLTGAYVIGRGASEASGDSREDLSERTFRTTTGAGKKAAFEVSRGARDMAGRHFHNGRIAGVSADGSAATSFFNRNTARQVAADRWSAAASTAQKRQIRKAYARAESRLLKIPILKRIHRKRNEELVLRESKTAFLRIADFIRKKPVIILVLVITLLFGGFYTSLMSVGTALVGQVQGFATTATSFTADDADILGANEDYKAMENELRMKLLYPEGYYPGYVNYQTGAISIGHDPYKLIALLTVLHERFTRAEVQESLKTIFALQYNVSVENVTGRSQHKTVTVGQSLGTVVTSGYCNCSICCGQWAGGPTASGTTPVANHTIAVDSQNPIVPMGTKIVMNGIEYTVEDTGPLERYGVAFDVYYDDHQVAENHGHQNWEAYIADDNGSKTVEVTIYNSLPTLSLSVQNGSIDTAARALLSDDELQRYYVIIETKGNRPDLFADDIYANTTEGVNWAPPGSALSDERFRNMYNEAIKYLGYPYVWGGESPDTSFDCSGFVSWVINHCGNGWNYGRLDCRELWALTMRVSEADVRPGDLVFFQGTWDVEGASHVGIVLGNGMMIHCGHPVQIASYKTEYFSAHFMGYGRLP